MLYISDLMPLTAAELDYRALQQRYPFIHQLPPLPLPDLLRRLQSYPEYEQAYQRHFGRFEHKTNVTEQIFQRPQDVEVVMHPRFVPGILHSHEFFELIYVLSGTVEHYTDNTPQRLNLGDICIIAPGVTHGIGTCQKDTLLMSVVLRASTFAETFFNILQEDAMLTAFFTRALYAGGAGILHFSTGYDREICQLMLTMLYEFRSNKLYNGKMLNSLMTACFILLLRSHADSAKTKDTSPNSAIVPILHYLQNNSENLTLHQLAQHFSYSDRQMTRLLVQSTGQNFTQLIQRLKLEKARILLAHSNLSIQEIINRCGYSNPTYFYRLFAKNFQMTPASYRQKQLGI
ncbi:putative AraC family transcriptional regulator (plasmid) [Selenomonas ruminantium subsp. lactilytica TAM6421]|uniref:Putative AraC family transcriptional regulator n=1 Tax=Selenomonas ruminantium subsp. lactilytica (strain NBRC 103574 / TAM6421) TaxID=927704 RepID=I0GV64_SELRL|nr:AraC family transcriptional regulator [Selenomonas ruminantium]BAL84651.1 putative AraC family transcriptional regulator [Selenomonas ruminantium subsp. lactilytica TAM6421]